MDKNTREKDTLNQWAEKNSRNYEFQKIDKTKDSYFLQRKEGGNQYIREYGVETLPELLKELDTLWGMDEIMNQIKKTIGVAALKNKPIRPAGQEEKGMNDGQAAEEKLPMFIYNF